MKVDAVEIFATLPDDEPFLIVADIEEQRALDNRYTVSACAPDGRVLQRWRGLAMLNVSPELVANTQWAHMSGYVRQDETSGAVTRA
jgi:hypothetical protein